MSDDHALVEAAGMAMGEIGKESVNKFSDFFGGFFPFHGLKKRGVDVYIDEVKNSDMSPETKMLTIANTKRTFRELSNQMAIAQIAENAAKEGTNFTATSTIDDEWFSRFMDSAKFVSDEEIQLLWGHVLAKKFEEPNSFPPKIIRVLSELTPVYAKAFSSICNLEITVVLANFDGKAFNLHKNIILDVYGQRNFYDSLGISFDALHELQNLGLVQFINSSCFFRKVSGSKIIHLMYGGKEATAIKIPALGFPSGNVELTALGEQLSKIVSKSTVAGYFDIVVEYLKNNHVEFSDIPLFKEVEYDEQSGEISYELSEQRTDGI